MKNRLVIVFFGFLALSGTGFVSNIAAQKRKTPPTAASKPLPDLSLPAVNGEQWSLHKQRGKIVLLNFWATWCAPCRTEVPYLVRLSNKYKASGLAVAGVTVDSENTVQINGFIKEFKIDYPILLTVPGSALARQKAVPMSLLIDRNGALVKKYVGAVKESVFENDVKSLLKKN